MTLSRQSPKSNPAAAYANQGGCRDLFWHWLMVLQVEHEALPADCLGYPLHR